MRWCTICSLVSVIIENNVNENYKLKARDKKIHSPLPSSGQLWTTTVDAITLIAMPILIFKKMNGVSLKPP